jgi:predicted anti-sigma-YlaC factor YlaD
MMMSCKKMTYLVSQQLDRKLTTRERVMLRFHLMMCSGCRNFESNLAFLRTVCRQTSEAPVSD